MGKFFTVKISKKNKSRIGKICKSPRLKRRFFQKWDFLLRVASPPPRGFYWISAKKGFLTKPFHLLMNLLPKFMFFEKFQKFVV